MEDKPKRYLRHLLSWRSEWMEARLYEKAAANGYGDITPAMAKLFAHMSARPVPMSEMARRLHISRQAVHKMANEGVRSGYIETAPSASDPRQRVLQFTPKGLKMAESAKRELDAIEARLQAMIGPDQLERLKDLLQLDWSPDETRRV